MKFVTDYFWIFFALAILGGIFLPFMSAFSPYIIYLLMFVLFLSCLKIDIQKIFNKIKNPKLVVYLSLLILIVAPLLFYPIFNLFLEQEYSLAILILLVMPAGMAVPVYATIFGGDKELALIVSTITSLLCPVTIPFLIYFLVGVKTNINPVEMLISLSLIIFIPFILAGIFRKISRDFIEKTEKYYSSISILVMMFVIAGAVAMINFEDINNGIVLPFLSLFALSVLLHSSGYLAAYRRNRQEKITSSLTVAYMNATLAIVFASQFFGPKTLLLVTLYQLPINMSLIGFGRLIRKAKRDG